MTYKDIINRFRSITNNHLMLEDFGYGDLSDLKYVSQLGTDEERVQYPYLYLLPSSSTRNGVVMNYSFNMIVMDMARPEDGPNTDKYDNYITIQSQCQQYIDDVLAQLYYFYKDKPEVTLTGITYTPFKEKYQDVVAGMTATITIQVPTPLNECIAPFNNEVLVNQVFVNTTECPAFDTAFRIGAEVVTPGYPVDRTANEFYAQFDEPGVFTNCGQAFTPAAINNRNSTTEPYYSAGDRRYFIPAGVTGVFRFDFDLLLTNVQGIDLSQDQLWIQVVVNGQQQTYIDFPDIPIDGTIVPFKQDFTIDAGAEADEIVLLFRYRDQGVPAPDGPLVGYTGTGKIFRDQ